MSNAGELSQSSPQAGDHRLFNRRLKVIVTVVVATMLAASVWVVLTSPSSNLSGPTTSSTIAGRPQYSAGVVNSSEPSGLGPISANAIPGFVEAYVIDFTGNTLPSVWRSFSGIPGGDPTGQFSPAHVVVSGGLLRLNTWKDPNYHNQWVTGGLCLCGEPLTYGAFFVRSRQTGSGPNEVELLWPKSNSWPPEIDFNESGGATNETSATDHWTIANHLKQSFLSVNLTKWHTWGVIWTPRFIKYTLDGQVWSTDNIAASIPNQPMTVDLEQRTICDPRSQCPTRPTSLLVDWVSMFSPSTNAG
jgi:hypothetical protein